MCVHTAVHTKFRKGECGLRVEARSKDEGALNRLLLLLARPQMLSLSAAAPWPLSGYCGLAKVDWSIK